MDDTIIGGEAGNSAMPRIGSGDAPPDEQVDALARLKIALERQTALREVADRALARVREEHEDAFERLLVRCRALESEKAQWIESEAASLERVAGLERHLAHRERESAHARELLIAEHDKRAAEREAVFALRTKEVEVASAQVAEERAGREAALTRDLTEAEERLRVEAFQLALRTKEVEVASAQVAEERAGREAAEDRFAAVIASSSWKLGRPLRVLKRALRRALGRGA